MAAPTVSATRSGYVTLDAFYQIDDFPDWGAELADGQVLVTPPPSSDHSWLGTALYDRLRDHVVANALGKCFPDGTGYELPIVGRPDTYRIPDVSFIRAGRIPRVRVRHRALALAPDLAVEIRSPSDTAAVLGRKLVDYLDAGTALVWVIDPEARTAEVHKAGEPVRVLHEAEVLDGGGVLPGFALRLVDLFAELE